MANVFFQIALNIAKKGDVGDGSDDEEEERAGKDEDGENHGEEEEGGNERVVPVSRDVGRLEIIGGGERVEKDSVDGLTGPVGKE